MALTVTAISKIASIVTTQLAMDEPLIIRLNADKSNIKYVVKPLQTIGMLSTTLANELFMVHTNMRKIVILCCTLYRCSDMLIALKQKLGPNITRPPSLPNILQLGIMTLFS